MYRIEVKRSALKALKRILRKDQITIINVIKDLAHNPRPHNCLKLAGSPYYRVRCGYYRIIYEIQDDQLVIVILKVGHRKEIYGRI